MSSTDITKCFGGNCLKKEFCHRYTSPTDEYMQSFFVNVPFRIENDEFKCDEYWDNDLLTKKKIKVK